VGFDDFVSQCQRQKLDFPALSALLNEVARQFRTANPNLSFGVTVYRDELSYPRFPLKNLDDQFRKSVDLVHPYPHYRREDRNFSKSVEQARESLPMSRMAAGGYAYDRRDYLPCARGGATPCTNQEEISLFAESLKVRLAMLGHSNVEWIEFYPGSFGAEAKWTGWQEPRVQSGTHAGMHPQYAGDARSGPK
jgi:hypothetical protein